MTDIRVENILDYFKKKLLLCILGDFIKRRRFDMFTPG